MALIAITRGDDLPDDCTIVIHKPAVPDARMPAHVMLEQAELLAEALEKYLPALTYTALVDRLGVRRGVSEKMREGREALGVSAALRTQAFGRKLIEGLKAADGELRQALSASADRGYDTLSCGHVATRFSTADDRKVPLVSRLPLDDSGIARPAAWCGECGMWIQIDQQQATELVREIDAAT